MEKISLYFTFRRTDGETRANNTHWKDSDEDVQGPLCNQHVVAEQQSATLDGRSSTSRGSSSRRSRVSQLVGFVFQRDQRNWGGPREVCELENSLLARQ